MKQKKKNKVNFTNLQLRFIEIYALDKERNATKAAIEAGYAKNTAAKTACNLLKQEKIRAGVRAREQLNAKGKVITQDFVLDMRLQILTECVKKIPEKEWDYSKHKMVKTGNSVICDPKNAIAVLKDIEESLPECEISASSEKIDKLYSALRGDLK